VRVVFEDLLGNILFSVLGEELVFNVGLGYVLVLKQIVKHQLRLLVVLLIFHKPLQLNQQVFLLGVQRVVLGCLAVNAYILTSVLGSRQKTPMYDPRVIM
jgi:hypothetical protein